MMLVVLVLSSFSTYFLQVSLAVVECKEGWSGQMVPVAGRGNTVVSVLDVLPLQVLANNTVCLQCAKLKYVKLSGGTNRAGASEQQAETGVCPRHQRLCCPASHHQLSTNEYFAKKIANMFLLRCRLLMF